MATKVFINYEGARTAERAEAVKKQVADALGILPDDVVLLPGVSLSVLEVPGELTAKRQKADGEKAEADKKAAAEAEKTAKAEADRAAKAETEAIRKQQAEQAAKAPTPTPTPTVGPTVETAPSPPPAAPEKSEGNKEKGKP